MIMFSCTTKRRVVLWGMIWVAGWTTSNAVFAQFGTLAHQLGESYVPMGSTGTLYTAGVNRNGDAIKLPFCFPYGDTLSTQLYLFENGFVAFEPAGFANSKVTRADILGLNDDVVAGFAENLGSISGSSIRYMVADNQVTIRYEAVPRYYNEGANTFEIRLHASGEIDFWYESITSRTAWMGLASTRMSPEILDRLTLDLDDEVGHNGQWYRYTPQGRASDLTLFGTAGTGGDDAGWRMLTMPGGAQCLDALRGAVPFCETCSMLMHYDPVGRAWVDATPEAQPDAAKGIRTLPAGQGFILYLFDQAYSGGLTETGLSLAAIGPAPVTDVVLPTPQEGQFHLLGNPFDAPLPVSQLSLVSHGFQSSVQSYNATRQAYDILNDDDQIAPWQGFFVERFQPGQGATTLTLSPPTSGKSTTHPTPITPLTNIHATTYPSVGTPKEQTISLAYHAHAAPGRDPYDVSSAPRVAGGLFLAFRESDMDYARLTMPTIPERLEFVVSPPQSTMETIVAVKGIGSVQCAEGTGDGITWIIPGSSSSDRIPCIWIVPPGSNVAIDDDSHDEHIASRWTVFPNPATTHLTFTTEIAWLEAFDLTGRRMGHWVNIQQLEIGTWTPGLYLLRDDAGRTQTIHRLP
jgi:hypothetical protein